jgi:NAD(P)H dehydrogenase (quinone)
MSIPTATVITASSQTGAACIEQLLTRYNGTVLVKAAFRSDEKAAELRAHHGENVNLEIITGVDAADPATLPAAFAGADIAYIVTPHEVGRSFGQDSDMNANMIQAAVNAGVKHIVFGGSWTVHAPEDVPDIASRFVGTEALLKALGDDGKITWTMIRGGWYSANTVCPWFLGGNNMI